MDIDPTERLCIPVQESDEVVVVPVNQLPEDPQEVLNVLISEAAVLPLWLDFARTYLQQGDIDGYQKILQEASSDEVLSEVEQYFGQKPNYEHIQCLCGFVALNLAKARDEKDPHKKRELINSAKQLMMKAQKVDPKEQLPDLAAGMIALAQVPPSVEEAKKWFMSAQKKKNNGRSNISGDLALALVLFHSKKYREALALYKQALRALPSAPPEVRLGLAACYLRLGDMGQARAAYERVIKLDPNNATAYLGLAMCSFNSQNEQQGLADGVKLLLAAFQLDPGSSPVMALLAQCCLMRGEAAKCRDLALAGAEAAESSTQQSHCYTLAARACHALGHIQEAGKYYHLAVKAGQSHAGALAHLGLAQVFLAAGEALSASTELEAALRAAPGSQDPLRLLAGLKGHLPARKSEGLVEHFRTGASKAGEEPAMWAMLGELLAGSDPAESLRAYEKAINLHRTRQKATDEQRTAAAQRREQREAEGGGLFGDDDDEEEEDVEAYHIPADLLNNTAVLLYRANRVAEALALLQEAWASAQGGGTSAMHKVTLGYNMARLQEETGDIKAAMSQYKGILEMFPNYTDCWLRLACIAKHMGHMQQAIEYCQKAVDIPGGSADAQALLGALQLQRKDHKHARAAFHGLLALEGHKHDHYGQLGMASYYAATAPRDPKKPEDVAAAEAAWSKARDAYQRVLRDQPGNIYAANGLGCCLAEQGHMEAAKEVFAAVQEAAAASSGFLQLPDVWVNLAHLHLARQEYTDAIKLYSNASRHHHHRDARCLLYLARAHYDADDLKAARQALLRAIHLAPSDHRLRFNLAVTLQEHAVRTFNKPRPSPDPSKYEEFHRAGDELGCALQHFNYLKAQGRERTQLDMKKVNAHVTFCDGALSRATRHLQRAEKDHLELLARRQAQDAAKARADLERQQAELAARAEQQRQLDEREKAAREARERSEQVKDKWRLERAVDDGLIDDSEVGGGGRRKGKKKSKKGTAADEDMKELFGEEEEGGAAAAAAGGEEAEYVEGADDDEAALLQQAGLASDEDEEGAGGQQGGRKRKRLRQAGGEDSAAGDGAAAGLEDADGAAGATAAAGAAADDEEDLFGDLQDDHAMALQQASGDEGEEGGGGKRVRKAAVLDSDDEEGGGGGGTAADDVGDGVAEGEGEVDVEDLF